MRAPTREQEPPPHEIFRCGMLRCDRGVDHSGPHRLPEPLVRDESTPENRAFWEGVKDGSLRAQLAIHAMKHERPTRHRAEQGVVRDDKRKTKMMIENLSNAQCEVMDLIEAASLGRGRKGYLSNADGDFEGLDGRSVNALAQKGLVEIATINTGRGGVAKRRTVRLTKAALRAIKLEAAA